MDGLQNWLDQGHNVPGIRNSADITGNATESISTHPGSRHKITSRTTTSCADLSDGFETHAGMPNMCARLCHDADSQKRYH